MLFAVYFRVWLSLVERLNGVQEAAGSTPVTDQKSTCNCECFFNLIEPKANGTTLFIYDINGEALMIKKNKMHLTDEQKKWNKMWSLWTENRTNSPYTELMTYQSEINNGGHAQYFSNIESDSQIQKEIAALETVLSSQLQNNLQEAYKAYSELNKNESDENAEITLKNCDDTFLKMKRKSTVHLKNTPKKIEL